jgi:hypothetical protein
VIDQIRTANQGAIIDGLNLGIIGRIKIRKPQCVNNSYFADLLRKSHATIWLRFICLPLSTRLSRRTLGSPHAPQPDRDRKLQADRKGYCDCVYPRRREGLFDSKTSAADFNASEEAAIYKKFFDRVNDFEIVLIMPAKSLSTHSKSAAGLMWLR